MAVEHHASHEQLYILFGGSGIAFETGNTLSYWPSTNAWIFQVTSLSSMSGILEDALREYNETYATMDLVLFEDAMKHVRYLLRYACAFSFHVANVIYSRAY